MTKYTFLFEVALTELISNTSLTQIISRLIPHVQDPLEIVSLLKIA